VVNEVNEGVEVVNEVNEGIVDIVVDREQLKCGYAASRYSTARSAILFIKVVFYL